MINLINLITGLLLLGVVSSSYGDEMDYITGRELQLLCADYKEGISTEKLPDDRVKALKRCALYMQGLMEAVIFYERVMRTVSGSRLICFPRRNISVDQAIVVSNEYIKKHPEKLDSQAVVLIVAALRETYPCNK